MDFAPGIPLKDKKSKIPDLRRKYWEMVVQEHLADRAGKHFDFRLSDGNTAYSWAIRKGLPEPGQKHLAIRQPDHRPEYMSFKGIIPSGYGKGRVSVKEHGKVRLLDASDDKIKIVALSRRDPEEFTMVRTKKDGNWLVMNTTPTRGKNPEIPQEKKKYKEKNMDFANDSVENPDLVIQPKYDGAHVITSLDSEYPRVFSYRPSRRSERLIQHTYRIPGLDRVKIPDTLKGTVVRGELFAQDKKGRPIPAYLLAALLNSSTEKSLLTQRLSDLKMTQKLFDVEKYQGKDVSKEKYEKKLKILKKISDDMDDPELFSIPPTGTNPDEKRDIIDSIVKDENAEGVVIRNIRQDDDIPIKVKKRPEHDVFVREIFPIAHGPRTGRSAGGFRYSLSPTGDIVGNVGTGFDHKLLREMWKDPQRFIGATAKVESLGKFRSGALRAPSFKSFHLEQGKRVDPLGGIQKIAFVIGFLDGLL